MLQGRCRISTMLWTRWKVQTYFFPCSPHNYTIQLEKGPGETLTQPSKAPIMIMRSEPIPVSYSTLVFPTTSMFISRSCLIPTYPEFVASLGPDGSLIVWVDFMKWGVLSANELNCLVNLVKRALATLPERSCCFAIGPQSTSERRGGLRDEFRIGLRLCYQKDVFIFCCLNHQPLSNWGVSLVVLSICFFLKHQPLTNQKTSI